MLAQISGAGVAKWRVMAMATVAAVALAACETTTTTAPPRTTPQAKAPKITVKQAEARLAPIIATMEPVAERECRRRAARGTDCDYKISVDPRTDIPPNAYQTVDKNGRPLIIFTAPLIAETRNQHELAFVMGHEAAHHIAGHLTRQQADALTGAALGAILIGLAGGSASSIDAAANLGASVGSRSFSKEYELEADSLGTVLTKQAGYDPLIGVGFFERTPDPGNVFLGTHPPNASRIEIVKRTAAGL
ncbi:M48 family metalloprotease [Shimia sp. R10_1]|uniref:M48 family metalloprotease n=1 Tax=Shimia sp. R10_1 TaxID=2821095 RepID=UPI001FFE1E41|nr:M48 family metalloprotease [Shimia sp. R10_1]